MVTFLAEWSVLERDEQDDRFGLKLVHNRNLATQSPEPWEELELEPLRLRSLPREPTSPTFVLWARC